MEYAPELLLDSVGPVRIVTLNRPNDLNAANQSMHNALVSIWAEIAKDPEAKVVILTGAGRAFSAGADFAYLQQMWDDPAWRRSELENAGAIIDEMIKFPLPVIGAINGAAVGLGCSLSVLCDLVLMSDRAFIADTHVAVGLTAADGGAPAWPVYMSLMRAKEYIFTGDRIPAEKAVEFGLATRVVAHDELMAEAMALAERLAALPTQALRTSKKALNMHLRRAVTGVVEYAVAEEFISFDTADHQRIVGGYIEASKKKTEQAQR